MPLLKIEMKKNFVFLILSLLLCLQTILGQPVTFDHTYGFSDYSYGRSIVQLPDSGYAFVANVSSERGNAQLLFVRLDSHGVPLYYRQTNAPDRLYAAHKLLRADNGDFVVTGFSKFLDEEYAPFFLRTDTAFNILWETSLPAGDWTFSQDMVELPSGSFVAVGSTYDTDSTGQDGLVMKIASDGTVLHFHKTDLPGNDAYTSVSFFQDSLLLVSGFQQDAENGDTIPFFAFLNFEGQENLRHTFDDHIAHAVANQSVEDSRGNIVTVGYTYRYDTLHKKDFFMIIFDPSIEYVTELFLDETLWMGYDDEYQSVAISNEGKIFIAGTAEGNNYGRPVILVHLLDADYTFIGSSVRAGLHYVRNELSQIIPTSDGGAILIGTTSDFDEHLSAVFVCKLDESASAEGEVVHYLPVEESHPASFEVEMFPVPASDELTIRMGNVPAGLWRIVLYDLSLKQVWWSEMQTKEADEIRIPVSGLPAGTYLLKLQNKTGFVVKKVVVLH